MSINFKQWILCLCAAFLFGCQTASVDEPTPSVTPPMPTVTMAVTQAPTLTATAISPPATLPPPATITQPPTVTPVPTDEPVNTPTTAPTVEPTDVPLVEPTAIVTEEADSASKCPDLATVVDARSPLRVIGKDWPRPSAFSGELYSAVSQQQLIHLGFDVEGDPTHLEALLDVLDRRDIKTTMFIVGSWAEAYPYWIQEMSDRGHEVANHTYSHGNLREMSAEQVRDELERTEAVVQRLIGKTTKPWLRPPFGSRSDVSMEASLAGGWTTVIWSGSSDDWRVEYDEDAICQSLLDTSYAGGILYAHTMRPEMPAAIDRYLGAMQAQGFTFVPLTVLLSANPSLYLEEN